MIVSHKNAAVAATMLFAFGSVMAHNHHEKGCNREFKEAAKTAAKVSGTSAALFLTGSTVYQLTKGKPGDDALGTSLTGKLGSLARWYYGDVIGTLAKERSFLDKDNVIRKASTKATGLVGTLVSTAGHYLNEYKETVLVTAGVLALIYYWPQIKLNLDKAKAEKAALNAIPFVGPHLELQKEKAKGA